MGIKTDDVLKVFRRVLNDIVKFCFALLLT